MEDNECQPLEIDKPKDIFLGQVVYSMDEAYNLYQEHAFKMVFSVRKWRQLYYDNEKKITCLKEFYCFKEGFKNNEAEGEVAYERADSRTNCKAMSMSSKMLKLCFLIMKMITKGYILPQHYISNVENIKSSSNSRLMKYKVSEKSSNDAPEVALIAHTDKSALAILCQNEAWSNGRLHATTHRVIMSGEKERYSFGLFAVPNNDGVIKVPHELVDDEIHPLRYKPFKYGEHFNYHVSTLDGKKTLEGNALEAFAGL
ncbi:Isopenicillin N synthase-like [Sesbania bispinosa]|nr:Isopenicillin N synthase-like [Sesbania bispinosa]